MPAMLDHTRLSDQILGALELALSQKDVEIGIILAQALDKSMTRFTGGGGFVERRTYSERLLAAQEQLTYLKGGK